MPTVLQGILPSPYVHTAKHKQSEKYQVWSDKKLGAAVHPHLLPSYIEGYKQCLRKENISRGFSPESVVSPASHSEHLSPTSQ